MPLKWKWKKINKILMVNFSKNQSKDLIKSVTDHIVFVSDEPMTQDEAEEYQNSVGFPLYSDN